jgi:hypothetical protein
MSCICPVYVLYMSCICPVYVLYMSFIYMSSLYKCPTIHIYNVHEKGKVNDNRFVKNWFKDEVSR